MTYNEVQRAMSGGQPAACTSLPELVAAARALRAQRRGRGAIDLDIPEAQVLLGPDGVAAHIRELSRLEAHRVIEDLMIAANEAVAEFLLARNRPTVFRVHEPPDPARVAALATWAATIGLHIDAETAKKPSTLARLAENLKQRAQSEVGMTLLLRSLAQARYHTENLGHYGLASRAYLHFTSPIRRYPDLLVHRSLRALWRGEQQKVDLESAATSTSAQERRAGDAERKVEQLMACHVAEHHVGEVFDAVITGVHTAGAFVRVKEPWLEGLMPNAVLGDATGDYYELVVREQALVGRRSGHRLSLGDVVSVRLAAVSTYRRHIDFHPVRIGLGERPARKAPPRPLGAKPVSKKKSPRRSRR